jgi:hypothetical protein
MDSVNLQFANIIVLNSQKRQYYEKYLVTLIRFNSSNDA